MVELNYNLDQKNGIIHKRVLSSKCISWDKNVVKKKEHTQIAQFGRTSHWCFSMAQETYTRHREVTLGMNKITRFKVVVSTFRWMQIHTTSSIWKTKVKERLTNFPLLSMLLSTRRLHLLSQKVPTLFGKNLWTGLDLYLSICKSL